ncbi:putative gustatory receptor 28b [Macrosteles quadrilineatus]|uniref:putative gustatory receptor 28b n=1 Tax=Macrosteles quadrilineatus TaxID=74068 RepID=UPI0023E2C04E|nr:putative gustatory receptor 28b [Macrosteles quadrilineatus]
MATIEVVAFASVPVVSMIYNWKYFDHCEQIWADVGCLMERLNLTYTSRQQKMILCGVLAQYLALAVAVWTGKAKAMYLVLSSFTYGCFLAPQVYHVIFVVTFQRLFRAVNERIIEVNSSAGTVSSQTTASQLANAFQLYTELQEVVQKMNSYFTLYLLSVQFVRSFFLCNEGFTFLVTAGSEQLTWPRLIYIVLNLTALLSHCAACEACCQEAHKTVILAHQLVTYNSPGVIIETVSLFSLATFNAKVSFSVGGVFSIDMSLVTKMLSLVISYLIVVLQLTD